MKTFRDVLSITSNIKSILQHNYGFGTQMYLISPHLEMAFDGRPAVGIVDTNCLIEIRFESNVGHICKLFEVIYKTSLNVFILIL